MFNNYKIQIIDVVIVIVLIILIIVITRKEKEEKFLTGLVSVGAPILVQDLINDMSSALANVRLIGANYNYNSNTNIPIVNNDNNITRQIKSDVNTGINNRNNRKEVIKNNFNLFLNGYTYNNIYNKFSFIKDLPLSFSVKFDDLNSNKKFLITISSEQNIRDNFSYFYDNGLEYYLDGKQIKKRNSYRRMVQYGIYKNKDTNDIFFIVKINNSKKFFDIYLFNIYEHINNIHNFLKTDWFCIGIINNTFYNICVRAKYNSNNSANKNYPFDPYTKYSYRLIDYVDEDKLMYITPDILNTKITKQFTNINSDSARTMITLYSGIEIFASVLNGNCLNNNIKIPLSPITSIEDNLENCKAVCKKKSCDSYEYNSKTKKCNIIKLYPPSSPSLKIEKSSGYPDKEENSKCYSNENYGWTL